MTDEQINVAIATHCGWTDIRDDVWHGANMGVDEHGLRSQIPSYCDDLNAMHEAESTLRRNGPEFSRVLLELVGEAAGPGVMYAYGSFAHVHASARLRAEAFLRTLGKWEEVQG